MVKKLQVGDTVKLKKVHACGNDIFTVERIGADYKLCCNKCKHTIMVDSLNVEKIVKKVIVDE